MGGLSKQEKASKLYLTDNRQSTIKKRETSYEVLAENEDRLAVETFTPDKGAFLTPRHTISSADLAEIPGLGQLRQAIDSVLQDCQAASGTQRNKLRKQLIEMRKDQYILKSDYCKPSHIQPSPNPQHSLELCGQAWVDLDGEPQTNARISFFSCKHITALAEYYNELKAESVEHPRSDMYCLLLDFEELVQKALAATPIYQSIFSWKINHCSTAEIISLLQLEYNIQYTPEYISILWRKTIPKAIADEAKKEYIIWHYTEEELGQWKTCSCCGERKLAHQYFFSRNKSSKDGWYSICKECRKERREQKKCQQKNVSVKNVGEN